MTRVSVTLGLESNPTALHVHFNTRSIDHTYHNLLLHSPLSLPLPVDLKLLVHMGGVPYEATLGDPGHQVDQGVCGGGQQEPVDAVEAGGDQPRRHTVSQVFRLQSRGRENHS